MANGYWYDSGWFNTGMIGDYFVGNMYYECITDAWFHACDEIMCGGLGNGFEAAAMNVQIGDWNTGTNYHFETLSNAYPNYQDIYGFWYYWYRVGKPSY
jgi:hypothetical protein